MSKLTRLQSRLTKVTARIADIENAYPTIAQYKSYSKGFGEVSTTYQEFGPIASEYHRLLDQQMALEDEIDELTNSGNSTTSVAAFRTTNGRCHTFGRGICR